VPVGLRRRRGDQRHPCDGDGQRSQLHACPFRKDRFRSIYYKTGR
jgi:hypothetical protein